MGGHFIGAGTVCNGLYLKSPILLVFKEIIYKMTQIVHKISAKNVARGNLPKSLISMHD